METLATRKRASAITNENELRKQHPTRPNRDENNNKEGKSLATTNKSRGRRENEGDFLSVVNKTERMRGEMRGIFPFIAHLITKWQHRNPNQSST